MLAQAEEQGVSLVGPGGLLNQLTRNVLETALEAELTEHLGHEHGQRPIAANMRNGTRSKAVLTEIGPVEIEVPRDRDGSFEPVIVPKRKGRAWTGSTGPHAPESLATMRLDLTWRVFPVAAHMFGMTRYSAL